MILSYTYVRDFLNCPKKCQHVHHLRDLPPKPQTAEMSAGIAMHEAFDQRLTMKMPLPRDYAHLEGICKTIEGRRFYTETALGMSAQGRGKGFWDKDTWARGKLDVTVLNVEGTRALLLDWKGGREWEDPLELQIQAALLAANNSDIKEVKGHYVWLKSGKVGTQHTLLPEEGMTALKRVDAATLALQNQGGEWPARPNKLCEYCPVAACPHNRSDAHDDARRTHERQAEKVS